MKIKQLSVFIENKSGRLANITTALGDAGVNIRALSLADTSDFGILRLIVSDFEKAQEILKERGFTLSVTEVVAVKISDTPGELGNLLTFIEKAELNIEYMYAFIQNSLDHAVMIFRFNDLDKAIETITSKGITVLESEKILSM